MSSPKSKLSALLLIAEWNVLRKSSSRKRVKRGHLKFWGNKAAKQATPESANCSESLKKVKCPGKCFIVLLHKQVPVARFNKYRYMMLSEYLQISPGNWWWSAICPNFKSFRNEVARHVPLLRNEHKSDSPFPGFLYWKSLYWKSLYWNLHNVNVKRKIILSLLYLGLNVTWRNENVH